jgi:energy-coupling factor transporter ATP-binding protein EcfA2
MKYKYIFKFFLATAIPRKKWTINGRLEYWNSFQYYFVDIHQNIEDLLRNLRYGNYTLFHGVRGCGKSTQALVAHNILKNEGYHVITISMQSGIRFDTTENFWKSFGLLFHRYSKIEAPEQFYHLFRKDNPENPFKNQKVILFIDEFDQSFNFDTTVESITSVLRSMKQEKSDMFLHAVCAIGTFSLLRLTGKNTSPFNSNETVPTKWLTKDQVQTLFNEWKNENTAFNVSDNDFIQILDDIYYRTCGHAGLVQKCGKVIDEQILIKGQVNLTYGLWYEFAVTELPRRLNDWMTMWKMFNTLRVNTDLMRQIRNFLQMRFLSNTDHYGPDTIEANAFLPTGNESNFADFLACEGALVKIGSRFALPSPLVAIALNLMVMDVDRHASVPDEPFPFGRSLMMDRVVEILIFKFNVNAFLYGPTKRHPKDSSRYVPREINYHSQFFTWIRNWAPARFIISMEYPLEHQKQKRCDLVIDYEIENGEIHRVIIEFAATNTANEIYEHINRTNEYAIHLRANEAWMVHFYQSGLDEENIPSICGWDKETVNLHVMHVVHDPNFAQATIFTNACREGKLLNKNTTIQFEN